MIWVILVVVLIGVSLVLAVYSMRSYQEIPAAFPSYSLFLIRDRAALSPQLLNKIHQLATQAKVSFSLEKLFKGGETALVIFAPHYLVSQLQELDPLELEDYLKADHPPRISVDDTFTLTIAPKSNPKKDLLVKSDFLKRLNLGPDQYLCWQIVCSPLLKRSSEDLRHFFQVTIRTMVVEKDAAKKIDLAKRIDAEINRGTGLISQKRQETSRSYFLSFGQRALTPKETREFSLSSEEIVNLIA